MKTTESNMRKNSVLIVESEPDELDALRTCIDEAGFESIAASSIHDALEFAKMGDADLVVSELALKDGSGFSLCRQLRETLAQPIPIMLTSRWSREADRILAFECGADDFIAKPYFARELASRVRTVLRRTDALKRGNPPFGSASMHSLVLDLDRRAAIIGTRTIPLTPQEISLLSVLTDRPGQVFTRPDLITRAWPNGEAPSTRCIDAHVKSLRRKFGDFGRAIETVRGVGYRYQDDRLGLRHPEDDMTDGFSENP